MEKQFIKDAEMVFRMCKTTGLYMPTKVKAPHIRNELFIYSLVLNRCRLL